MRRLITFSLILATATALAGCADTIDKLEQVGKTPEFKKVENPQTRPDYQPLTWPMPQAEPPSKEYANSLWRPGARSFFRDQRAGRVGDILRVKVTINDKAELKNETKRDRSDDGKMGIPSLFGGFREKALPGAAADDLIGYNSNNKTDGKGEMKRDEKINTQIAALVTQVLPNGNLVIEGSQEIRVNFEVRELLVKGVVRPEDIGSDNTIDSSQIAESRIAYGGRGQMTDIQQPRWGSQVVDIVSPF